MKRSLLAVLAVSLVTACASSPKPEPKEPVASTSSALSANEPKKEEAKESPREALDPLSVGTEMEASSVPKVEQTPAKELRAKSRGDLAAAVGIVQSEKTFDGAVKKLTARLGKPTWIENGKRRVWIAKEGKQCSRFVLDVDGEVTVETADASDWRMLSATAQQNACTGEIRRGVSGSK
jgi:hypothetical protein